MTNLHSHVSIAFRLGVRPPQDEDPRDPDLRVLVSIAFRLGVRPPPPITCRAKETSDEKSPLPFGWGCGRPYLPEAKTTQHETRVSIAFRLGVRPPLSAGTKVPVMAVGRSPLPFGWGCGRPTGRRSAGHRPSVGLHCLSAGGAAAPMRAMANAADSAVSPLPFGWGCGRPNAKQSPSSWSDLRLHCLSAGGAAAP